ncbi:hypothetical protein BGW39_008112 [Mortierella sp. 14UC]|nr:hypothetical protein BGW39_008112 [Mortierella sp. 14UC]
MLEASSLRSRKQSFSPTQLKANNNNNTNSYASNTNSTARNTSAKDRGKSKNKDKLSMTNDSGTSVSEAVVTSDSTAANRDPAVGILALGHEAASSQGTPAAEDDAEEGEIDEDEDTSMQSRSPSATQQETSRNLAPSRVRTSKLSAEDLNGGLLDGALDDEDEDMDGDTEDTEPAPGATPADPEVEEEEEGEINEDQEEDDDEEDDDKPADTDDDTYLKVPKGPNAHGTASPAASEDLDDGSNIGDVDGDVAMTEQEGDENDDEEDESTPAGQTDDEGSELPEEDGSHGEDGDEDGDGEGDGDEDEDEDEDDDEEDDAPATPKKDVTSFPQKPTLNRPQLIAEDLKDSGDDLSDLSEFDDTDDSDDEEVGRSSKGKASSSGASGSTAATTASSSAAATGTSASAPTTNSRPSLGGRKRSLREASRETKVQEKVKDEIEEDEETNAPQSDKETESEMAEEETNEKGEGEEEGEEEEDLEKKQVYTEALEALSSIEVEFAHLRDRMYEERMLELETEVEMINDGKCLMIRPLSTHPELSTLMKEIEDKRDQRLRVARAWRTHMIEISDAEFEIKEYKAHCTFQSKKRELRTDLINGIGQKQQQLRLELTLAENRARHQPIEKSVLIRARKHKRAMVSDLRAVNERYGFPVSNDLRMVANVELDEDFAAMGFTDMDTVMDIHKGWAMDRLCHKAVCLNGLQDTDHMDHNLYRWVATCLHPGRADLTGMRPDVEIYEDGSRCKVDGIWYKPNDPVVVLDAVLGQYHAKYLFLTNDEIMLQRTDGTKTRLHLSLFRARKLYMQPRP